MHINFQNRKLWYFAASTKNGRCPKTGVTELALWLATFAKTDKRNFSEDIVGKCVFALQHRSLQE